MISITPVAQEQLTSYLTENKADPKIRIHLAEGGCGGGGSQLSMMLSQSGPDDLTIQIGDMELFISKNLSSQVGKVTIDFKDDGHDSGFVVESEKPIPTPVSASGCGGCTSCG